MYQTPNDDRDPRCRVAHFHSSLGVYGAERWTLTLLDYLDRERYRPLVLTIGDKPGADALCREAMRRGFDAVHLPLGGRLSPRLVRAVRERLVQERVRILHTHGFKSDVLGVLAAAGLPVATVATVHGWSAAEGWRIRAYEALGRLALRRFERVYPLSPALAEDLRRRLGPARVELILNAVDIAAFGPAWRVRRPRKPEAPFHVLYVGRLCRPKGVADLLQAWSRLDLPVAARLSIVGDGPERADLERLAAELGIAASVHFAGARSNMLHSYAAADALVLPSHSEGIPRVIMEAFASGVPAIGTAIPGIRQLIRDGETGLLVPVGDPDAIAGALTRLATAPGAAYAMARNARELVEEQYSGKRLARDFEREYERLAALPARAPRPVPVAMPAAVED